MEKFVTISPSRVRFTGEPGVPLSKVVTIVPEKKYAFKILSHKARNGDNINYTLEETKSAGIKNYKLTINNTKLDKGRYSDRILVQTDSKIQPEIQILISGNIFERPQKVKKKPAKQQ